MKQLIINADDFGLHEAINQGIIQGYQSGCITSASIMPNGEAFENAVALSMANPGMGTGVHLTLVGEKPLNDPGKVMSLVDKEGFLSSSYIQFLLRFIFGQVRLEEVRLELWEQVRKVVDTGIHITHLDSHQHLHVVPGILDIAIDIAKEFKIKAIRIPDEPYWFFGNYPFMPVRIAARAGLTFLSRLARKRVKVCGLAAPDHFFGMLAGGNMREEYLINIVDKLPDGVSEIMMHPGSPGSYADELNKSYGWDLHWQSELDAVTSRRLSSTIKDNRVSLVSFKELHNG